MTVPVKDFLKARRDRALGAILGYAERELFDKLERDQQLALRNIVLGAMNSYHDSVLDLLKAEDGLRNDEVIALLQRLDQRMSRRPAALQ